MAQTGSLKEELDEINHKFLDSEELLDTGVQHEFSKTFTGITSVLSWSDQQDGEAMGVVEISRVKSGHNWVIMACVKLIFTGQIL